MDGYVFDYMVALTYIACLVWVLKEQKHLGDILRVSTPFVGFCALEAFAYGINGLKGLHSDWTWIGSANNIAIVCSPIATMLLTGVVLIIKNSPKELTYASYGIGVLYSACSAFLILAPGRSYDASLNHHLALGACTFACVMLVVDAKESDTQSRKIMLYGMLIMLAALVVHLFAPADWFPAEFNKNEIFHCLLVPSAILQCKAVIDWDVWKLYQSVETAAAKLKTKVGNVLPERSDLRSCRCEVDKCAIQ
mmetsp:Transcript_14167/g.29740  ORF Transcript_14167/g.29740 Transcript_14167/m.29740 type:complete len:251 (-) Transcript_14167:246-998(-)